MKQKSIQFLAELHRLLHDMKMARRLTFVDAEVMDAFCLKHGYASSVAAYEDLPEDIKRYIYMSRNKANPFFYAHAAFVCTPPELLFVEKTDPETGETTLGMSVQLDKSTLQYLKETYYC